MDFTEKKLRQLNGYQGLIVDVHLDRVALPDGTEAYREIVEHPGGVTILPVDKDGTVYCVRQYRYAFGKNLLEAPAGKLEYGENPMDCAVRELSEEVGITAGRMIDLGSMYPSPGFCREVLHVYLALDLKFGEAHLDPGEFLDVVKMPFNALKEMVLSNEIQDAKTVIAVLKAIKYVEAEGI